MPKAQAKSLALEHASLLKDIRKLEEAIRSPKKEVPGAICTLLKEIKEHVSEHFRFEEKDGYMSLVRKRLPNKEGAIVKLFEEHRHLAQSLDGLINEAGKPLDDDFREIVQKWIDRIRHHEAQENALIQAAFNLEIGGED
jgi:hemerythrin-like domain-containing protein